MSAEVRPLPIWPHDVSEEQLDMIRRAKLAMNLPYKIEPVPAVPGSPGRILCFGGPGPMYGEHVIIAPENVNRYESIARALEFALTAAPGSPGSFSEEAWLSAVMGCEVNFLYEVVPDRLEELVS